MDAGSTGGAGAELAAAGALPESRASMACLSVQLQAGNIWFCDIAEGGAGDLVVGWPQQADFLQAKYANMSIQ